MKNKSFPIYIPLSVIAILGLLCYMFIFKKKEPEINNTINQTTYNESKNKKTEISENNDISEEYIYDIKSTENNHIEKDGIEAENIRIHTVGSQTKVTATIKNNSKKTLDGFFIEIKLLDEKNNELTSIAENSEDIINPNESIEFSCYMSGFEKSENIKNAIISVLEAHK